MEDNLRSKKKQDGRIFAGLILVCVGAALLLRNTGFPMPRWLFSWPMILILVGLYTGIKNNFANKSWIILMAIGGFFLFDRFMPEFNLAPYFWPIGIIALGVLFILRPDKDKWGTNCKDEKKNAISDAGGSNWKQIDNPPYSTDTSDTLQVNSVFSGVERNVVSKNFQGGKIICVFGGADIDLSQADIHGTTEIRLEVAFGGVKLIVPPHWTVNNQIDGIFHGVEDKRKFHNNTGDQPRKILVLKGSVIFGGAEIKSF